MEPRQGEGLSLPGGKLDARGSGGKFKNCGRPLAFACTLCGNPPAVPFGNGANQEQPKPGASHLGASAIGDAIKTFENSLQFGCRNAHSAVLHSQDEPFLFWQNEPYGNVHMISGILDGIIENVRDGGTKVFGIATHL